MFDSLMTQLFSGITEIWLSVVYVACMFLVQGFRPQPHFNVKKLHLSYYLFAAYLLTLPTVQVIVYWSTTGPGKRMENVPAMIALHLGMLLSRGLYAAAVIIGLQSLFPNRSD